MNVEYLDLADYLSIAAEILGLDTSALAQATRTELADSALHAPQAGFGGVEFYAEFVDKAAVLLLRLTKNHPLPDGNKRAAWVSLRYFVALNHWTWCERPSVEEAEAAMVAVAAGEWDEERTAAWLRPKLAPGAVDDSG